MRRFQLEIPEEATATMRVDASMVSREEFREWVKKYDALTALDWNNRLIATAEPRGVRIMLIGPPTTKAIATKIRKAAENRPPGLVTPYLCTECGRVDDVDAPGEPPLCSQCDPRVGVWHGLFDPDLAMPVTDLTDTKVLDVDSEPPQRVGR